MVMRGEKRKGVRYFGPFAHAYAIRETLDLLLRTFPIRTCTNNKFQRHERLGRPCLYAHIEKCVAPCVAAIDHEEYQQLVNELISFLDGETAPVLDRLEKQMHEASEALDFERARAAAGPAALGAQGHRAPADGRREGRGPRRHRDRRGRARSVGAGVLRARGSGHRAQGPRRRQGRGRRAAGARRPDPRAALRRRAGRGRAARGARAGRAGAARALRGVPVADPREVQGADPGAATGREARAARDGDAERAGGVRSAQAEARVGPQRARPHAARAAGGARPARGAAAHRVLRHLEPAGHRDRRVDDRARGRAAEAVRLPPLQDQARGPGRLRRDGGGARPVGSGATSRSATKARAPASGSRTRRTCS